MKSGRGKQKIRKIFIIIFVVVLSPVAGVEVFDDTKSSYLDKPDWFVESPFLDIKDELEQAFKSHKHGVMVMFTANGCSYCDKFIRSTLKDPDISQRIIRNFRSISLDVFSDNEMTGPQGGTFRVKEFAVKEQVQFTPSVVFYDTNGKRILRVIGLQSRQRFNQILDYVTQADHTRVSYSDYLAVKRKQKANNVEQLGQDDLFSQPQQVWTGKTKAKKPIVIVFERKDCESCRQFYVSVLDKSFIRRELAKFDVVRLDAGDDNTRIPFTDETTKTPMVLFNELELNHTPALVFLDKQGSVVLKTDADVLPLRMMLSMHYVLEKGYAEGWTYQKYAKMRSNVIRKLMQ